ncbi:hypothetical protein FRB90_000052 [Tulasnella sp. 427]|nr:hypothetical protein FRB90_000052 [Tulasnella sp. 427]
MRPRGDGIKPGIPEYLRRLKSNARTFSEANSIEAASVGPATPASRSDQPHNETSRRARPPATFSLPQSYRSETDEIVRLSLGEPDSRRNVPTRLLDNFVIFDANDGNAKVSLLDFVTSKTRAGEQDFRAYGEVSSYSDDIGLEPEDSDDNEQPLPLALRQIVALSAAYGSASGLEIYVATEHAWYRLGRAERSYRFKYAPFWKRHFLVHTTVYAFVVKDVTQVHDLLNFVEKETSPDDRYLLRDHPWTRAEVNGLVGTLGPELEAYAERHFPEDDARTNFLSTPLISKLISNSEGAAPPESVISEAQVLPRRQRAQANTSPLFHMMPFTGKLAQKVFNANFKIHCPSDYAKSRETPQERVQNNEFAEDILEGLDQMPDVARSVVPKATPHGVQKNVRKVEIRGLGEFKIGGFALLNKVIPNTADEIPPDEADPSCKSPNNVVNEYGIIFIRDILQENNKWRFHGQVMRPASQTVLRELAHSRELVFTRTCLGKIRPDQLLRPVDVQIVKNDGVFVEPPDEQCRSVGFFARYQLGYNDTFQPLEEHILQHEVPALVHELWRSCPCMESIGNQDCAEPTLFRYQGDAAQDGRSPVTLMLRDKIYRINDFVYLAPGAPYSARPLGARDTQWRRSEQPPATNPGKRKRKGDSGLGVFLIGQILNLKQWSVEVRMLGRYEELVRKDNQELPVPGSFVHFDHLYLTHEERRYETTDLAGVCHARHAAEMLTSAHVESWRSIDGFRVSHILRLDADVSKPLTLASIQDLWIHDFTSASQEVLQAEDEEMEAIIRFPRRPDLRCYDLFHGAGGWSSGFKNLGWEVLDGVDIDPDASATFQEQHINARLHAIDARGLLKEMLRDSSHRKHPAPGDVDLLLAGPPCQEFSGLNRYKLKHDGRKALVALALTIAEYLKPKYVMIENVVPLLSTTLKPPSNPEQGIRNGVHKYVLRCFTGLGYNVRWKVYDSAHFGAPQTRCRLIYVASRRGLPFPNFIRPTHAYSRKSKKYRIPSQDLEVGVMDEWDIEPRGAPHYPLTVRDAIQDLPPFDWEAPKGREDDEPRDLDVPEITCEEATTDDSRAAALETQGLPNVYRTEPQNDYQAHLRRSIENESAPIQHVTRYFSDLNVQRRVHLAPGRVT